METVGIIFAILGVILIQFIPFKLLQYHRKKPHEVEQVPNYDNTSFSKLYFSFRGRIPLSTFWFNFVLPYSGYLYVIIRFVNLDGFTTDETIGLLILFILPTIYPASAMIVKRAHDVELPWWIFLFHLLPLILNLFVELELLLKTGTTGTNKYGRDPLELSTNIAKDNLGMLKKLALVFTFIMSLIFSIGGMGNIITSQTKDTGDWIIIIILIPICIASGYFLFRRKKEPSKSESQNITVEEKNEITNSQIKDESIESKLEKLKSMLDKELITEDEFNAKKQKLIDEM